MHRILERQIKRSFGLNFTIPPEWKALLEMISDTYTYLDEDRALLNRSLDLSSKEFLENSRRLEETRVKVEEQAHNLALEVAERTKDLNQRVVDLEDVRKASINLLEDLREEQKALAEAKAKDEAILGSIADGCIVVNEKGEIILMNQMAQNMLGYTSKESVGKKWFEILHREDEKGNPILPELGAIAAALSTTITTEKRGNHAAFDTKTIPGIYYYVRKDKTKFPVAITVAPVVMENKVVGAIEVFRDITKEKEVDRAKTEFVTVASHSLRTPLTAIDGLISMILDGDYGEINKDLEQPLKDVNTSSQRLIHLVNDLLNLSRIQAGRMKYALSEFSIKDVITETVHLLQPLAQEKGLQLITAKLEPVTIQADSDKVKEILNNLIGNSLKFTDRGSITISTKVVDPKAEIHITDTGIGIAKEDQRKLFGMFQQLESSQGRSVGTGLGLHLSRKIISKMGGELWLVRSEVGRGSTFAFSLPLAKSHIAAKTKEETEKETRMHPDQKTDTIINADLTQVNI